MPQCCLLHSHPAAAQAPEIQQALGFLGDYYVRAVMLVGLANGAGLTDLAEAAQAYALNLVDVVKDNTKRKWLVISMKWTDISEVPGGCSCTRPLCVRAVLLPPRPVWQC